MRSLVFFVLVVVVAMIAGVCGDQAAILASEDGGNNSALASHEEVLIYGPLPLYGPPPPPAASPSPGSQVSCLSGQCSGNDTCWRLVIPCGEDFDTEYNYCDDPLAPEARWIDCSAIPICQMGGSIHKFVYSGCSSFCGQLMDLCCCFSPSEVATLYANCRIYGGSGCTCRDTCTDCRNNCP